MLEFGQILGLFSAAMLVIAVAAWVKLRWGAALHPVDGRSGVNPAPAEFASLLLVLAFGLSALAAIFAVVGWIGL
jgi:hypothetical protein